MKTPTEKKNLQTEMKSFKIEKCQTQTTHHNNQKKKLHSDRLSCCCVCLNSGSGSDREDGLEERGGMDRESGLHGGG